MKIYAENIKNLQDEVLSISNSSLGTSYIFGGFNYTGKINGVTKEPPFSVEDATGISSITVLTYHSFHGKANLIILPR
jgi:flagellin-like hook-associated protein FlgL